MQVKVQTVNELTINQLSEDQYKAEKAAGRIKSGEVYACTPSPVKWEDIQNKPDVSKDKIDFQELSRRIPSWQWKVTMPKTVNQTVTATVNGKTYTDDFYAPQGSQVTFSAKADTGYIAGSLSPTSAMLNKDFAVTVTVAEESEEVEAGEYEWAENKGVFTVPPNVHVIKCFWNSKDVYCKVNPGDKIKIRIMGQPNFPDTSYIYYIDSVRIEPKDAVGMDYPLKSFSDVSSHTLKISWSTEINEHAFEYDWTGGGIVR